MNEIKPELFFTQNISDDINYIFFLILCAIKEPLKILYIVLEFVFSLDKTAHKVSRRCT